MVNKQMNKNFLITPLHDMKTICEQCMNNKQFCLKHMIGPPFFNVRSCRTYRITTENTRVSPIEQNVIFCRYGQNWYYSVKQQCHSR